MSLNNKLMLIVFVFSILAIISTFIGGLFALRFKDKLHLVLGFSAGAVLGVAFFDLLPEMIELGEGTYSPDFLMPIVALGFMIYLLLDRALELHGHGHEDENAKHHKKGLLGAGSLSLHSFLDGVAIGLSFQVSTEIGLVVAAAVLVHDFSDGINTVNMVLKNRGSNTTALRWLIADALAPALGALTTLFFTVPQGSLAILLALFSGFFLYIGASDLLPESHHSHPTKWTTFATIVGVLVLYGVITFAGHH